MYNNLTGKLFYHDPSWRHKDKLTGKVNFIRFLRLLLIQGCISIWNIKRSRGMIEKVTDCM